MSRAETIRDLGTVVVSWGLLVTGCGSTPNEPRLRDDPQLAVVAPPSRDGYDWTYVDAGFPGGKNILGCGDVYWGRLSEKCQQFRIGSDKLAFVLTGRTPSSSIVLEFPRDRSDEPGNITLLTEEGGGLKAYLLRHTPVTDAWQPLDDAVRRFLQSPTRDSRVKQEGVFELEGVARIRFDGRVVTNLELDLRSVAAIPKFQEWLKYWENQSGAESYVPNFKAWAFSGPCSIEGGVSGAWINKKPLFDVAWP